ANISPWATWMKLGTTSLVLRLIEHDFANLTHLQMLHPLEAAKLFGKDYVGRYKTPLVSGQRVRAIDIQEELLIQCHDMADEIELPKEEYLVLKEWDIAVSTR